MIPALRHNPNWQALGNCGDVDPEVMFPEDRRTDKAAFIEAAKWVCWAYPVARLCLADAMDKEDWRGVRGGLTGEYRFTHKWMSVDQLLAVAGLTEGD